MSVQIDFEKEFEAEEYEMLILVQSSCKGAVIIKDMLKQLLIAGIKII